MTTQELEKFSFATKGTEQLFELFPQCTVYEVTGTFTVECLGTVPYKQDLLTAFVMNQLEAPPGDELETAPSPEDRLSMKELLEKGWTGFHRLPATEAEPFRPIIYDYAFKGFLKETCQALKLMPGSESAKLTAFKKRIDKLAFVYPRQVPLLPPEGKPFIQTMGPDAGKPGLDWLERPIRCATPQGERVALVRSDCVPVGTSFKFQLAILGAMPFELIKEWLTYAAASGMGQWRSGGYGRFIVTVRVLEPGECLTIRAKASKAAKAKAEDEEE